MAILPRQTVQNLTDWPEPHQDRASKIRLDAGEHTEGFAQHLPKGIAAEVAATYPGYTQLLEALSKYWKVEPNQILLTNGSDEGLELIAETFVEPGLTRAICNNPSFIVIPRSLQRCGAFLEQVPVRIPDLSCDEEKVKELLLAQHVHLAVFAAPDNPTGMMVSPDTVREWCQLFPETLFVIDEAYFEFTRITCLPLISECKNLIVTRTFSKAWGLAGLRIGALIGDAELIKYVRRVATIYNVNSFAVQTVHEMLPHYEEVFDSAEKTMQRKTKLIDALIGHGFDVHEGKANFFLLNLGEHAVEFAHHLEAHDILVRVCAPTATPAQVMYGRVRVSIGTQKECDAFLSAAREFLKNSSLSKC